MAPQRFRDYTVVITGASSGIGACTAQAFAREGARVVLVGRRVAGLQDLARRIGAFNPHVLAAPADMRDEAQVRGMVDAALARFGRIDILVNNAAVLDAGPVADMPADTVRAMFETNVLGLLACTRAVVPHMRERGIGHIVNVSSVAGYVTVPPLGVYSATKHAVQALSSALRVELAADGIAVTTICPGPVATAMSGARYPSLTRLAAHTVAARILDAVHAHRREVFMPGVLRLAPLFDTLAPDLGARLVYRVRRLRGRRGKGARR